MKIFILTYLSIWLVSPQNTSNCYGIPYNFATRCNITCQTCNLNLNTDSHQFCETCPSYLGLWESHCVPQNGQIFYRQYFSQSTITDQDQLIKFQYQNGSLTTDNVTTFCVANIYRFQMIGPLDEAYTIRIQENYDQNISQIAINFRIFFYTDNVTLDVSINNEVMYSGNLDSGVEISKSYDDNNNELFLPNDPTKYINSIFLPVKISPFEVTGSKFVIEIRVKSSTQILDNSWFFNELNILALECTTCISQTITNMKAILGFIIAGSAFLVIFCTTAIYLFERIQKRNWLMKNRTKNVEENLQRTIEDIQSQKSIRADKKQ